MFEASALGFGEAQGEDAEQHRRQGQDEVSPPPCVVAADEHGNAAHHERPEQLSDRSTDPFERKDPRPGLNRVGVGDQRVRHGDAIGLPEPGAGRGPEELERVDNQAGQEGRAGPEERHDRNENDPIDAVGERCHRHGAEDEGDTTEPEHAEQDRVRDPEAALDVGGEDANGSGQFVDQVEQQQEDGHALASSSECLPQGHRLVADAGEKVVGESDPTVAFGLGALPGSLFVENGCSETRGVVVLEPPVSHDPPPDHGIVECDLCLTEPCEQTSTT